MPESTARRSTAPSRWCAPVSCGTTAAGRLRRRVSSDGAPANAYTPVRSTAPPGSGRRRGGVPPLGSAEDSGGVSTAATHKLLVIVDGYRHGPCAPPPTAAARPPLVPPPAAASARSVGGGNREAGGQRCGAGARVPRARSSLGGWRRSSGHMASCGLAMVWGEIKSIGVPFCHPMATRRDVSASLFNPGPEIGFSRGYDEG